MFVGLGVGTLGLSRGGTGAWLPTHTLALDFTAPQRHRVGSLYGADLLALRGPELVTNGGFDSAAGWTLEAGWAITGGQAVATAAPSAEDLAYLIPSGVSATKTYRIEFDATIGAGGAVARLYSTGVFSGSFTITPGRNVLTVTGGGGGVGTAWANAFVVAPSGTGFTGTIDNVSVREVPATYTRAGAKSELNSTGSITSYAANVPGITDEGYWSRQAFTNLALQSQAFDTANWAKTNLTVASNTVAAPDGSTTADTVTIATASSHRIYQGVSVTPGTTYTFSFWALRGTATALSYSVFDSTNAANIVASTDYYALTNATTWTRITITFTAPTGCTSVLIYPLRDGSSTGTVHLWQAQLVTGTTPGPIILTTGSAATVAEDNLPVDLPAALTDQDMLIWARGTPSEILGASPDQDLVNLHDGTASNSIEVYVRNGLVSCYIASGGAGAYSTNIGGALSVSTEVTSVLRRSGGNWRIGKYVGGILTWGAEAAGAFPAGLTKANLGNLRGGAKPFRGRIAAAGIQPGTFDTDAKVIAAIGAF